MNSTNIDFHEASPPMVVPRAYRCNCGRPVFFRNSECLACQTPLGYDPDLRWLMPIEALASQSSVEADAAAAAGTAAAGLWWRAAGEAPAEALNLGARQYLRCANLASAAACNWLVPQTEGDGALLPPAPALCRCCRLTTR